jgi:hypothetical protein
VGGRRRQRADFIDRVKIERLQWMHQTALFRLFCSEKYGTVIGSNEMCVDIYKLMMILIARLHGT